MSHGLLNLCHGRNACRALLASVPVAADVLLAGALPWAALTAPCAPSVPFAGKTQRSDKHENTRERRKAQPTIADAIMTATPPAGAIALPSRCSVTTTNQDDDDSISRTEAWPQSVHCSGAGLSAVPPLPRAAVYVYVHAHGRT